MTQEITTLDPDETEQVLATHRFGKTNTMMSRIAQQLMVVRDTGSSVFATGLSEGQVNSLRTRMYRADVMLTVRKVSRDGVRGHVIVARTTEHD